MFQLTKTERNVQISKFEQPVQRKTEKTLNKKSKSNSQIKKTGNISQNKKNIFQD